MNTGFFIQVPVRRAPWFSYVLAATAGLLCAGPFFLFARLMPGMFDVRDKGLSVVIGSIIVGGFAVYHALLGSVFGFIWPMKGWRWGVWLSIAPALVYSFFAPVGPLYLLFTLMTFAPACAGSAIGSRIG